MGFAGAILIYCFEQGNIAFIDTLFCSVSAITGTGLQTVSNLEFSRQSVAIIALLMFFGSIFIFLIPPMVARQYYNRKVLAEYKDRIDDIDPKIIEEHNNLNEALTASIRVSLVYMALWHILISLVIYGALFLHPQEPELVQRGYTRYQNSLFMTISAFANCGFTISSSAIFYWSNNPLAYFALSLPILAGNTCIPILFYFTYWSLIKIFDHFRWNSAPFRYILQNPSQISSHTLPWESTKFLLYGVLAINTTEYVFFLASSWYGQDVLGIYGSYAKIAGMGYFETISTRNAGIQV